ncbi:acetyltransferase [Sphingobacterium sp.]|uniref:acetyltransferase n=1 Tax=Sphingobacterium sp. TaxID=341027 RepID=UPI0028ABA5B1|nr:acetyltransferase [Sphingobacterium sp.]
MKTNKVSILGASGHAKVIIDIAETLGYIIEKVYDQDEKKRNILNYPVCHSFFKIPKESIIAIGNNKIRKEIASAFNLESPVLIHPSSNVSKYSELDSGSVVMSGVSINAGTRIGKHCIINTNSSIDHDCVINDFVHISPNVSLAGNVDVGEGSHIGIGACVIQGVKIGKNCIVGAGAVVIRDIKNGLTVVGNPAKALNKK